MHYNVTFERKITRHCLSNSFHDSVNLKKLQFFSIKCHLDFCQNNVQKVSHIFSIVLIRIREGIIGRSQRQPRKRRNRSNEKFQVKFWGSWKDLQLRAGVDQFHQHFRNRFFEQKWNAQLFLNYNFVFVFFSKRKIGK